MQRWNFLFRAGRALHCGFDLKPVKKIKFYASLFIKKLIDCGFKIFGFADLRNSFRQIIPQISMNRVFTIIDNDWAGIKFSCSFGEVIIVEFADYEKIFLRN